MKYLIITLLLSLVIVFCGCQKEISIETNCGIVKDKYVIPSHHYYIEVKYVLGEIQREEVGLIVYSGLNVGDQYCK